MSKKMFDIMPPKLAPKSDGAVKPMAVVQKSGGHHSQKSKQKKTNHHSASNQFFSKKNIFIGGAVLVLLLCAVAYVKLPKADIQIWPKTTPLTLGEKITADTSAKVSDVSRNIIPAQYIEIQKDAEKEFDATGITSNDGKAQGTIKIYNKLTPASPFTLLKGTHFLSDSGKYFITLQKVTIPAAKNNSPGSISVTVQAAEVGTDYNIKASKFSIPKLYGSAYYYVVYAESTAPMLGGHTGTAKKVTEDDIQNAKAELTKSLMLEAQNSLKDKLAADDVLLDGVIENTVVEAKSSAETGAIADTFNFFAKVKASALVFKKGDLEKLAKGQVALEASKGSDILDKSFQLHYDLASVDIKGGKLAINAQSSITSYSNINTTDIINVVSKKSSVQITQAINQMYGGQISKLKVNFWPFWVTTAPKDKNRINIKLNFE